RLRTAVDREVFWRRDYFEITGIVPLQSLDEGDAEARGKIGIFAVGFLAAAPARVAKDVDIRAPEGKPFVTGVLAVSEEFVVFSASLGRDDVGDLVDEVFVPGGGETDSLWEDGGVAGARDAVQGLVPPVVGRDTEAIDRRRDVLHLGDFLFQGHSRDQVVDAL